MPETNYIALEDWKGQKLEGTVVYFKENGDLSFGFINPNGGTSRRADHVWFGTRTMQGCDFQVGDEVKYALNKHQGDKPNLSAVRVWMLTPAVSWRDKVTTLAGIDDL